MNTCNVHTLCKLHRLLSKTVHTRKFSKHTTPQLQVSELRNAYDVVIIGAGHNGLVAAAYLQKSGIQTCVLEKRHVVGGAAVTEEIVPGFKFSRASYLLSLLRPHIYEDLELKKHGLKIYPRNPSSYTPLRESTWQQGGPRSLTLGPDDNNNKKQIARFSPKDAEAYKSYEEQLQKIVLAIEPLLDLSVADTMTFLKAKSIWGKISALFHSPQLRKAVASASSLGGDTAAFYELLTSPASRILAHWFESEPLQATLATDAVIGTMAGPDTSGSGYVLLHHVMGEVEGVRGGWGYPEGGMGAVTQAMASAAHSYGAQIFTNTEVTGISLNERGHAVGVVTSEGHHISAKVVLSNATPHLTFEKLLPPESLPENFQTAVSHIDYKSPVTKINVAVRELPNFVADPCTKPNQPMPHHQCTIHINCESTELITEAYTAALDGNISDRPMIEMVIPSSVDPTLAPPDCHVCLLFTQYTPYHLANGLTWNDKTKEEYAKKVFSNIEEYAPGFTDSIIGMEVLSPPDLEEIFGLTGGNIFHGALSLDQLFLCRPTPADIGAHSPFTPVNNLLLCGSGAHPGGGVMGAPGHIAAQATIKLLLAARNKIEK